MQGSITIPPEVLAAAVARSIGDDVKWLDVDGAAGLLGMDKQSVMRLCKQHNVGTQFSSRLWRISLKELRELELKIKTARKTRNDAA